MRSCAADSLKAIERAVAQASPDDLVGVAALQLWIAELGMNYVGVDPSALRGSLRIMEEELAQRLVGLSKITDDNDARIGYLVRGFKLSTEFGTEWTASFPSYEVDSGAREIRPAKHHAEYSVGLPSND